MKNTRRWVLALWAVLAMTATLGRALPAFAEGSNDPIPGIDVIIERDPSVVPIMHFGLTDSQMKKFNAMKSMDRSRFLASILAARLAQKGLSKGGPEAVASLTEQLGKSWCGRCERGKTGPARKLAIKGPEFKGGISAFITAKF